LSLFITFEGPEGSGKTTQIGLLAAALLARRRSVLVTREPGGTRIGDAVRGVLLNADHTEMSERAEALLFNAARAQLVAQVIRPALAQGETVLCDRYGDSTLAYQGHGHAQPLEPLRMLIEYATGGLAPHLTIYLDLDVRKGLARKRAGAPEEWNRIEEKALAYHEAVRRGYLAMAEAEARWLVVDAALGVEEVHARILRRVEELLG
jgi:dTMP kinase